MRRGASRAPTDPDRRAARWRSLPLRGTGSILSNSLLVLGFACLSAGVVKRTVCFDETGASNNTNMLLISIMAISIPALMNAIGSFEKEDASEAPQS